MKNEKLSPPWRDPAKVGQINNKNLLFRFWPIGFIILVWFVFSAPYFLKHKVPFSSTYQANFFAPWSAYHTYEGPIKNAAMPDVIDQIYPWKHFTIESFKKGYIPLWNPYSFSGTPHLANYQSAVLSPFNLLFIIFPFIDSWSLLILFQPLLAGIFMYLFMQSLKTSKFGSLISAIGFMFCGFITTWMGYGTLGYAFLFLPLALFAIEKYYQTLRGRYVLLFAITIPLSFFSGHFQISIYFLLAVIIYIFYKLFSEIFAIKRFIGFTWNDTVQKNILITLYLVLYTLFGLLLAMPQIFPSIEAYSQSVRSGIFQKSEVIPWAYLPTLLVPDFFGNPVTRNDWFGHYAEWNGYIGLLPLFLGFYIVLRKRNRQILFFFTMSVIALLLALPAPLLDFIIAIHIPVLSTSAASRVICIFSFFMLVLGGLGFDQLQKDIGEKKNNVVFLWFVGCSLYFVFLWGIIAGKLLLPLDKIFIAQQNLVFSTILFLSIIFVVTMGNVLNKPFGIVKKNNRATEQYNKFENNKIINIVSLVLLLIMSVDMLRFAIKWQSFDSRQIIFTPTPLNQFLTGMTPYTRVFGSYEAQENVYYQIPAIEGYDTLYIKRYGEFIHFLADGNMGELSRSVVSLPKNGQYTPDAINLLGINYIVHKITDNHAVWAFPFWTYPNHQFKLVYSDKAYQVLKNTQAFPHVFLAEKYVIEKNPQKILQRLFDQNFDRRNTIVLETDPHIQTHIQNTGKAEIISYEPNKVTIAVDVLSQELLFLSDNYYPGWHASVDGKETSLYRADYTFRSIVIPLGKHIVTFIYSPLSFALGLWLAFAGVIQIIALLFLHRKFMSRK